mgnify:CR=1 FL=1
MEIFSGRQLDEIELISRSCDILINKCKKLENLVISNLEKEESDEISWEDGSESTARIYKACDIFNIFVEIEDVYYADKADHVKDNAKDSG